jgi:hypothetical protein
MFMMSVVKLHREVSLSIPTMPRGRYVIVPATLNSGVTGDFFLSVYFSCPKEDITFQDRDYESDKGAVIEEEEEIDPQAISNEDIERMKAYFMYLIGI